jgi:putative ABC transport system ATP-binding protein
MSGDEGLLLELREIQKHYWLGKTRVPALQKINLSLRRGEFSALVGSSGSGKSTLLNVLGCLDVPTSGQYEFEGQRVFELNERSKNELRNRKIGFVFQSFNLIPVLTVAENVEIPLLLQKDLSKIVRSRKVAELLDEVGLLDFADQKPEKLSGGQRQRVAIARALVTGPTLVLADEPTANLDSKTAHQIIDLMLKLNNDRLVTFLLAELRKSLSSKTARSFYESDFKDGL